LTLPLDGFSRHPSVVESKSIALRHLQATARSTAGATFPGFGDAYRDRVFYDTTVKFHSY
jgi:hypothetical protein